MEPAPEAIKILLSHVSRKYDVNNRAAIARALISKNTGPYWREILELFLREDDEVAGEVKWALACVLNEIASKQNIDELIRLTLDPSHGSHRLILVRALGKVGGPAATAALKELRTDSVLSTEVEKALQKLEKREKRRKA